MTGNNRSSVPVRQQNLFVSSTLGNALNLEEKIFYPAEKVLFGQNKTPLLLNKSGKIALSDRGKLFVRGTVPSIIFLVTVRRSKRLAPAKFLGAWENLEKNWHG